MFEGSMQTEQWLFDDRAEYRFRDRAPSLKSFPHGIYDRANLISVRPLVKGERRDGDLKKVTLSLPSTTGTIGPKIRIEGLAVLPAGGGRGTRPINLPPRRKGTLRYDQHTHPLGKPMELADVENRLSRFFGRRPYELVRDDLTIADWETASPTSPKMTRNTSSRPSLPDVKKEDVKSDSRRTEVLTIAGRTQSSRREETKKKYHRVGTRLWQFRPKFRSS